MFLDLIMGFTSVIVSFCAGFYFRNTTYGSQIGNKIFAAYKILQNKGTMNYKLVLVVREDLGMGRGKIASQCSHASVIAYRTGLLWNSEIIQLWEALGQAKVVVKTQNESSILKLYEESKKLGLNANIVSDAGRTEVASGTKTVLAVGPGPSQVIDQVTGHLKLL